MYGLVLVARPSLLAGRWVSSTTGRVDMNNENMSGIRQLTSGEIGLVSGGDLMDSHAFRGGAVGGMLGSIFGSAFTGSSIGASRGGLIGAALGFSFGLGWGIGSAIYSRATTRRR